MSDNILDVIKFDAGIQTENGYEQFSITNTIGNLIGNREYKESFDKFKNGNNDSDSYIWKTLSAISDQTGNILYENIKNYIDYVTNIDVCKILSLRSMIKIYGLNYKIFDNLNIFPNEILDLINIFSINKKYILHGNILLDKYKDYLSSEGINAIYNYNEINNEDIPISANIINTIIDYDYPIGGKYYDFVVESFNKILNNFLNLSYEKNGLPIYKLKGDDGIYNDLIKNRSKYTLVYQKDTKEYDRRKYKILHNISLQFDECAALDRIEHGIDSESMYSGAKAELILMEKEWRLKSFNNNKTSKYAFYKKLRVLEYVNFVTNKYFADHKSENLSLYSYNKDYFEVGFKKGSGENAESIYADTGAKLINSDNNNYTLNTEMIHDVAQSLADTAFYISNIREKIKLLTRKNYMKGTYDLILYVINEFLVDYSRTNPIFRNIDPINVNNEEKKVTASELLKPIYANLSSHDINNLTAIEYFDETEYFNIATLTDIKSEIFGTNDRFWENPGGESLIKHNGIDSDFDINSITSFYMDTLGIRDNYISDENTLCAFLDAVFNLGAVDSFIHKVSSDYNNEISSASELFGAQIEKYGKYSDDLYNNYLNLKLSWNIFTSYLSNEKYEYLISDCVSAQVLSVAEYIKLYIYNREFASVSAVYNKYIEKVDEISSHVNQSIENYNNLLSGEYSFYFNRADSYKYCFDGDTYKHEYYINSRWDSGLEYLYDMLYKIKEYASSSDDNGNYITNWPIHDTVKYFYESFIDLSSKYISMTTGLQVPDIGLFISHNWSTEYGFVDISAVSLENEFKHGYDFINENIKSRRQFILDKLNNLKSLSIDLSNKSQNIKNSLTLAIALYKDGKPDINLGDTLVIAFSLTKVKGDYMDCCRCQRTDTPNIKGYSFQCPVTIAGKTYYYYDNEEGTGDWAYDITKIPQYKEDASVLSRCNAIKKFMEAPTTFYVLTRDDSYYNLYNYELMDEGVFAAITQVESDFISLLNSINNLVNEINNAGFELELSDFTDIDASINEIITFLNSQVDENIVENDSKIKDYKLYISAIIKLSAMYSPIKYEYDSIFKDLKQSIYLSEFLPDIEITLAALSRLSSYNIDKDNNNKNTIILTIDLLLLTYLDIVLSYLKLADDLSKEYMLPLEFLPYSGYIEEMLSLMYSALNIDVNNKIVVANNIALNEFDTKLYPAATKLIIYLSPYENYLLELPVIINKKLKELYYFNNSNYLKQKEMFLTYGGRSFCYYPYFNLKNTVHSSYQVHPFLWNFVKREHIYGIVSKTFFSVNIDELEKENIALNWHKFYGEYGEIKYNDISKQRYPDYFGYSSRYEDSIHIAENTQFVSEVVDYDGAFYPPAIEWIKTNGLDKAIASIRDLKYNLNMVIKVCSDIYELSSLEWEDILNNLIWMNKYKSDSSINTLTSNVYNKFYNTNNLNYSKYDICDFIKQELSSDDTFYGRFYRLLRLDQDNLIQNKEYIIEQLKEYWSNHNGNGPSISDITKNCTIDKVHDIYKYGIDSYGNMYCLYKLYDQNLYHSAILLNNELSYKYKQSTPGELWIRFKNHPIAFPAFSGSHPNVYIKSRNKRHSAFVNLFDLYKRDIDNNIILKNNEPVLLIDNEISAIQVSKTSCIYDFEFTKDKNDITFITLMYNNDLSCLSRDIQNYQNSWLVHCRPTYDVLTSDIDYDMSIFRLYSPNEEVDYFQSGDNYDLISKLSDLTVLDNSCTLYLYIGSYLKGNSNIYHVYAKKYIYRDEFNNIIKEACNLIKICPVINGRYSKNNDIFGNLIEDNNNLSIIGPDICMTYNESINVLIFAALTVLANDTAIYTDSGEIYLSSNIDGPIINDPINSNMNSHDIFDTNITLFKKQVVSKLLRDIRNINESTYTFNTNADMSYFPAYPGLNGITKLYKKSEYYDYYSIELLGTAKDISLLISFVNPNPDPYLNIDGILSNFANARVYQDYIEYTDETLKIIDNKLIGCNSKIFVNNLYEKINQTLVVLKENNYFKWLIRLNKIYLHFDLNNIKKLKILLFNKKCYGKNPYIFADINKLIGNKWFKLLYDNNEKNSSNYNSISPSDYITGYNNLILVQSTLNGLRDIGINDSNHIYNIDSILARLIIDKELNLATLEFKFILNKPSMINYTFIAELLLQVVLLDTKNLEIFNYFHYLDTYGVLRVIDYFKSIEEINANRIKYGDGWKIYHAGYNFSEEELMNKLKSYYEYKNKMIPLSSVDLSQYNCLSDVYILLGSRKLAFKQDESFRYELSHPGYFYPTINAKFPVNPVQYMMLYTTFKEDNIIENLQKIFNNNNLFILDIENPDIILSSIGKIDIPIILDDSEYIFAYEDYLDINEDNSDNRRNYELYDSTDSYVLLFIQFEADNIPFDIANENRSFEIPNNIIKNISIENAINKITEYLDELNINNILPIFSELYYNKYIQEYIGFTIDNNSLSKQQMIDLLRIYVNYRKYNTDGEEKIELYFNYINYLNSPYLKILDNKTYVDTIDNTYLSLKLDEDGTLNIIAQFKYYKGEIFYGYRNVKLASYQIYNISDDKPKFIIRKIDTITKNRESNESILPISLITICDMDIDIAKFDNKDEYILFNLSFIIETNTKLKSIEFYLDYPSDFIEFVGLDKQNVVTGRDWSLHIEQPGYAKIIINPSIRIISIPVKSLYSINELQNQGDQDIILYIDKSIIIGQNNLLSQVKHNYGKVSIHVKLIYNNLNVLLTGEDIINNLKYIFNTEYSPSLVKAYILEK